MEIKDGRVVSTCPVPRGEHDEQSSRTCGRVAISEGDEARSRPVRLACMSITASSWA